MRDYLYGSHGEFAFPGSPKAWVLSCYQLMTSVLLHCAEDLWLPWPRISILVEPVGSVISRDCADKDIHSLPQLSLGVWCVFAGCGRVELCRNEEMQKTIQRKQSLL